MILGFVGGVLLNAFFRAIFFYLSKNYSTYWVTNDSIIFGVIVGLIIPTLSNIYPI